MKIIKRLAALSTEELRQLQAVVLEEIQRRKKLSAPALPALAVITEQDFEKKKATKPAKVAPQVAKTRRAA